MELDGFNFSGTYTAPFTTAFYDVHKFQSLHLIGVSNNVGTCSLLWSTDGINTDSTDLVTLVASPNALGRIYPIRAKYLAYNVSGFVSPATITVQSFFYGSATGAFYSLDNVGGGVEVYKLSDLKLRTFTSSDGSLSVTQNTDTIDVTAAAGGTSVVALNENVQVTEAPAGQFNVGTGLHDAGALTLGWNVPFPVVTGAGGVNLGDGRSTGASCVAVGENCGNNTSFGSVSIGGLAGNNGSASNYAVNIGYSCASAGTHGTETVCIGYLVGLGGAGKWATLIGSGSAFAGSVPQETVAIGRASLLNGCTTTGINPPVAVGSNAGLFASTLNATGNVMLGYKSLYNITKTAASATAGYNTAIGHLVGSGSSLNESNVLIGDSASDASTFVGATGSNTIVGSKACRTATINGDVTVVGASAGGTSKTIGSGSTIIGKGAGSTGTGSDAVLLGRNSGGLTNPTGQNTICIGGNSGNNTSSSVNSMFIGPSAGSTGIHGNDTIVMGNNAGNGGVGDGAIAIGYYSSWTGALPAGSIAIGSSSCPYGHTGGTGVFVGKEAGNFTSSLNTGNGTYIGYRSGYASAKSVSVSTITNNTIIGDSAGANATLNNSCVMVGTSAGEYSNLSHVNGGRCVFTGVTAGYRCSSTGQGQVMIGDGAGIHDLITTNTHGTDVIAIGRNSLGYGSSDYAIAIGYNSADGGGNPAGAGSICIGREAGKTNTVAANEICIGENCTATNVAGRVSLGSVEAVQTTATAGAQTLPSNPAGFMRININGTLYKLALYND